MNTKFINDLNTNKLTIDFLYKNQNEIIKQIQYIENQINLLFIYCYALSVTNHSLLNVAKTQLNKYFNNTINYENFDLAYIYSKNEKIDLKYFFLDTNLNNNNHHYEVYFNNENIIKIDSEDIYFDLDILNLDYHDYVDYLQFKNRSTTSMNSHNSNKDMVISLLDINNQLFDKIINSPIIDSLIYPTDVLSVDSSKKSMKVILKNDIEEHEFNPFQNKLNTYENLVYINKVFKNNNYYNELLLFYVLSNIEDISSLDEFENIKNFVFITYANEIIAFNANKIQHELMYKHNLSFNQDSLKFKNIILIDKFIDKKFKKEYVKFCKSLSNSDHKQTVFLATEYLKIKNINLLDFFDELYLNGFIYDLKYRLFGYNESNYKLLRNNSFFKKLYTLFLLEKKDMQIIISFYQELHYNTFVKFTKKNKEFFTDYKGMFFDRLYSVDFYDTKEYNDLLLKNILNDYDCYNIDTDFKMIDFSKDKKDFYDRLPIIKKGIIYYIQNNPEFTNLFDKYNELFLNNIQFTRLIIEQENELFISQYIESKKNTNIILDLKNAALKFDLDISPLETKYSTILLKSTDDIF